MNTGSTSTDSTGGSALTDAHWGDRGSSRTVLALSAFVLATLPIQFCWAELTYPEGYTWRRTNDWTVRPTGDQGTSNGNPDNDLQGEAVWEYGWVTDGTALGGNDPWYRKSFTKMVWTNSWFGQPNSGCWVRAAPGTSPQVSRVALLHIVSPGTYRYTPVVIWKNPMISPAKVRIQGSISVSWEGPAVKPTPVDVVMSRRSSNGVHSVVFSQAVAKPTQDASEETASTPIQELIALSPGDSLVFSCRVSSLSTVFPEEFYVFMTDAVDVVVENNRQPSDINLNPDGVRENTESNSVVGLLQASDPDNGDTHTYTLVDGDGDSDNETFSISGAELKLIEAPDFEVKPSYSVRIRATDNGTPPLSIEKAFTITVSDVSNVPIRLFGNGVELQDGNQTPLLSNHSRFVSADVFTGVTTRTFTIRNTGTNGAIRLTGNPSVTLSGEHSGDFTVSSQPPVGIISAGGETTFQVAFNPSSTGARRALVTILSDDTDTSSYSFAIDGEGTSVDLDGNGFNAFDEMRLASLFSPIFHVGDSVSLDVGAIVGSLPSGQEYVVTGLPRGLTINKTTGLISGPVSAENGESTARLTIRNAVPPRSIPFNLRVLPYPYLGSYEALIEESGVPVGKLRLTVTGPRTWSASLELRGQRTRSSRGTFTTVPFTIPFAGIPNRNPALVVPDTLVSVQISRDFGDGTSDLVSGEILSGSFDGATLRGFRLIKPGREPRVPVTAAFHTAMSDPIDRAVLPAGIGHATGTADGRGLLPLRGMLGDAQPFTSALMVSQTNQAVVFLQPYRDKASSFFGGILNVGDLGLPSRGAPTESITAGLQWRKYDDPLNKELSYPNGFGIVEPLKVTGNVNRWVPMATAHGLALSLGLNLREMEVSYVDPPSTLPTQALPERLGLRWGFGLVSLSPFNSVPWSGRANGVAGAFSGNLTLPAPATRTAVSGVFWQKSGNEVGFGLLKIPVAGPGIAPGSFQTSAIELQNDLIP